MPGPLVHRQSIVAFTHILFEDVHDTSAITPIAPQITAALAWAPDMPPRPDVTYTFPAMSPVPKYLRTNGHTHT